MNKQQIIRFSNVKESSKTIAFSNYNEFIKKYRALRMYCPRSYKYICFKVLPNLKILSDGEYTIDIPTDPVFAEVYGKIKLHYDVTGGKIILKDLSPSDFLRDGYKKILNIYKGTPYRNKKDLFKIQLVLKRKELLETEN